jgi:hypothetical protein
VTRCQSARSGVDCLCDVAWCPTNVAARIAVMLLREKGLITKGFDEQWCLLKPAPTPREGIRP